MASSEPELTEAERASLFHHAVFGAPSTPPTDRVASDDWKQEPIEQPDTLTCTLTFPRDNLDAVIRGFQPKAMEDKWFIYADGPDDKGHVVVHMIRSWTGYRSYEAHISTVSGDGTSGDPCITKLIWETGPRMNVSREKVVDMVKGVFQYVLGIQLH